MPASRLRRWDAPSSGRHPAAHSAGSAGRHWLSESVLEGAPSLTPADDRAGAESMHYSCAGGENLGPSPLT